MVPAAEAMPAEADLDTKGSDLAGFSGPGPSLDQRSRRSGLPRVPFRGIGPGLLALVWGGGLRRTAASSGFMAAPAEASCGALSPPQLVKDGRRRGQGRGARV